MNLFYETVELYQVFFYFYFLFVLFLLNGMGFRIGVTVVMVIGYHPLGNHPDRTQLPFVGIPASDDH